MSENNTNAPEDLFQDDSTIPESDWVKFEDIGDMVQGVLLEEPEYDKPGKFGTQNIYTLETAEGVKMVGLNPKSHIRAVRQLKQAEIGDVVAIKYTGQYDSGKGNPGKQLEVRIKHMNAAEKMAQQL